ncbi:hypothetical protein GCM10027093_29890 [Paraburkholderia jirisanensis]
MRMEAQHLAWHANVPQPAGAAPRAHLRVIGNVVHTALAVCACATARKRACRWLRSIPRGVQMAGNPRLAAWRDALTCV